MHGTRRGFTLIELLVVVAIIGVLTAILFPVFVKAREKTRQSKCLNNQRQIATAIQIFAQDHDEIYPRETVWGDVSLPPGVTACPSQPTLAQGYIYSGYLSGKNIASVKNSLNEIITADGAHAATTAPTITFDNLGYGPDDLSYRHVGSVAVSFVDGHVQITDDARDLPIEFRRAPAAVAEESDATTQGGWWNSAGNKKLYGTKGYVLCGWGGADVSQLNDYVASVTPSGTTIKDWALPTDPRGLVNPATGTTACSGWIHDGSYAIRLTDANDTAIHTLRLYFLDVDNQGLQMKMTVRGADGTAELLKKPVEIHNIGDGVWYKLRFRGNITIHTTRTAGTDAVVSAFMFD